jgi:hypothetical protein
LLVLLAPSRVFLIAYYGKIPLIAACKSRGIEVVELMHGTIVDTHPQYNFPKSYSHLFRRGLFPDKIAVFGEYWKQVLIEGNLFPPDAIVVSGYYFKVVDPEHGAGRAETGDRTVVLFSTQPKLQREFCDYVSFLKSRLDPERWQIIIKPHPKEDKTVYAPLVEPDFVAVSETNVYELLTHADVHISVYSSVVHEAARYGVCNYALFVDSVADHWRTIVDSGVALPLLPDQIPEFCVPPPSKAHYYFAEYDPSVLFGA